MDNKYIQNTALYLNLLNYILTVNFLITCNHSNSCQSLNSVNQATLELAAVLITEISISSMYNES